MPPFAPPLRSAAALLLVLTSCGGSPAEAPAPAPSPARDPGTAAGAVAAPPTAVERRPDLLLVTLDTTRPDLFGAYGHGRDATPNLDRLAAQGAVFERHYSTSSMTCPSHATMLTGLIPAEHGLLRNGQVLASGTPTLPALLGEAGYRTAAVVGSMVLDSRFGLDQGFEVYDDEIDTSGAVRPTSAERDAESVVDRALEVLAEFGDERPVFLWVHLFDPHRPFEAPVELMDPTGAVDAFLGRVETSEIYKSPRALASAFVKYENEVRYTDREVGRLLEAWDARAHAGDSAVVVTADHGEGMGEHGYAKHVLYVYEEQIHVPFLLRAPGRVPAGVREDEPTTMLDLAATLSRLAGLDEGVLPGHDLTALLADPAAPRTLPVAQRPLIDEFKAQQPLIQRALAQFPDRGHTTGELFALVRGRTKYFATEEGTDELYDLVRDPQEGTNLVTSRTELAAELRAQFERWRGALRVAAPSQELDDENTRAMLEQLGYR